MALTPLKVGRVLKEGVSSGNQGEEVNYLARHLEVEAGWSGVAERSCSMAGIGRREVEDRTNRWGPLGGDRGRRRRRWVAQTQKGRCILANTPLLCRSGWAKHACGLWENRRNRPVAGWAAWPGGPAGRWADCAESEGKILFRIKIGFLNLPRLWKFVERDLGGILA
jgi:hypothetical protein